MIHIVKQGEYLAKIAKQYRFAGYKAIWNHSQNAEFKKKRENPNFLYPGDELFVPDKEVKEHSCATGQRHRFKVKGAPLKLRLDLKDMRSKVDRGWQVWSKNPSQVARGTWVLSGEGLAMVDASTGSVKSTSGGISATHPTLQSLPVWVAPASEKDDNTLRTPFVAIACWRLEDLRFEFGASYIKPQAAEELTELAELVKKHPEAPLSISGHADPHSMYPCG